MALAFSILMTAPAPAVQATGFLLTSAVLIDTFVIRTMLVPSLLSVFGDFLSWWPRAVQHVGLKDEFDRVEPVQ
jgi:uncharacterized membrane protein YdfJ with MMPL/SSD domain